MIEIVLSMIPVVWLVSMTIAGLEPREKLYEDLVEHLEKLEVSPHEEQIPKRDKNKDASVTTSILKKDVKDTKPKFKFVEEARRQPQESCELCKVMKGADNPAWKTYNTSECCSKEYYKKGVAGSN